MMLMMMVIIVQVQVQDPRASRGLQKGRDGTGGGRTISFRPRAIGRPTDQPTDRFQESLNRMITLIALLLYKYMKSIKLKRSRPMGWGERRTKQQQHGVGRGGEVKEYKNISFLASNGKIAFYYILRASSQSQVQVQGGHGLTRGGRMWWNGGMADAFFLYFELCALSSRD